MPFILACWNNVLPAAKDSIFSSLKSHQMSSCRILCWFGCSRSIKLSSVPQHNMRLEAVCCCIFQRNRCTHDLAPLCVDGDGIARGHLCVRSARIDQGEPKHQYQAGRVHTPSRSSQSRVASSCSKSTSRSSCLWMWLGNPSPRFALRSTFFFLLYKQP